MMEVACPITTALMAKSKAQWQRSMFYIVAAVLWIPAFPMAFVVILIMQCFCNESGTYIERVARSLWIVELQIHRLYDTSRAYDVPTVPDKHAGWTILYCILWKLSQRLYYWLLDAAVVRRIHLHPFEIPVTLVVYVFMHLAMVCLGAVLTIKYYLYVTDRKTPFQPADPIKPTRDASIHSIRTAKPAVNSSFEAPKGPTRSIPSSLSLDLNVIENSAPDYQNAVPAQGTVPDRRPPSKASYYTVLTPPGAKSSSAEVTYGQLSPAKASRRIEFAPTYRSIDSVQDGVHFHAFAPSMIAPSSCFRFDVWAYLVHQRETMLDQALHHCDDMNDGEDDDDVETKLSRDELLRVRRGALAHVSLEVPPGFELHDEPTQALEWTGRVTRVKYQVTCTDDVALGQVLFKSTIVIGASVMILRSYVFVGHTFDQFAEATAQSELRCNLEVLPTTFHEIPYDELEIQELVGQGNFGDAYRANYRGKQVVVKTVRGNEFGDNYDRVVEAFRHEAAVLNMFGHHPNIVPFVGACTDSARPLSLVTEYLPCGSIEDQYGRGLSDRAKEIILADAAAGFLNIHEGGFVHRDIAARNCLVDKNGRAKVCDFGMCRRVDVNCGCHVQTKSGVGPIKYMAPETLRPPHAFSFKSDSYAFGVLMWETFMETPPFADISAVEAAARVLEGARLDTKASKIPAKYQKLMAQCFQEDPTRRPSMAEIVDTLRNRAMPKECIFNFFSS
ncbi:hypothetical protein Ae201684_010529 [Aphanomyces euteiches]|uniref:Protein kinase domain-containing protein n=1 Tax=Aphanomyces euteiches TaxID=100861 RepID=A0A6G0WY42_9STRA|nr:hypothetical protein Ae201684_010529 [Aphanomyces euteiches]KAH9155462.1 hypothetical protein AeRB84_002559 [Aphanomyces euteiches]